MAQIDPIKPIEKLHKTLVSDGYDMPELQQFESDMADDTNRQKLWDTIKSDYELPEFDQFSEEIGFKKKADTWNKSLKDQMLPSEQSTDSSMLPSVSSPEGAPAAEKTSTAAKSLVGKTPEETEALLRANAQEQYNKKHGISTERPVLKKLEEDFYKEVKQSADSISSIYDKQFELFSKAQDRRNAEQKKMGVPDEQIAAESAAMTERFNQTRTKEFQDKMAGIHSEKLDKYRDISEAELKADAEAEMSAKSVVEGIANADKKKDGKFKSIAKAGIKSITNITTDGYAQAYANAKASYVETFDDRLKKDGTNAFQEPKVNLNSLTKSSYKRVLEELMSVEDPEKNLIDKDKITRDALIRTEDLVAGKDITDEQFRDIFKAKYNTVAGEYKADYVKKATRKGQASAEMLADIPKTWDEAVAKGQKAEYLASGVGEVLGSSGIAAGTLGAGGVILNTGEVYDKLLTNYAKDLSERVGKPVSKEEIVALNQDKEVQHMTEYMAPIVSSLDLVGTVFGAGGIARNLLKGKIVDAGIRQFAKRGAAEILGRAAAAGTKAVLYPALAEVSTEVSQSLIPMLGSNIIASKIRSGMDIDEAIMSLTNEEADELLEVATKVGLSMGVLGGPGSVVSGMRSASSDINQNQKIDSSNTEVITDSKGNNFVVSKETAKPKYRVVAKPDGTLVSVVAENTGEPVVQKVDKEIKSTSDQNDIISSAIESGAAHELTPESAETYAKGKDKVLSKLGKVSTNLFKVIGKVKSVAPRVILLPSNEQAASMARSLGYDVKSDDKINGWYNRDTNTMFVTPNTDTAIHEIMMHPVIDALKQTAPERYQEFIQQVAQLKTKDANGNETTFLEKSKKNYEGKSDDVINEEAVVDYLTKIADKGLDTNYLQKIVELFEKYFGVKTGEFNINLDNPTDVQIFAKDLAKALRTGRPVVLTKDQTIPTSARVTIDKIKAGDPEGVTFNPDFSEYTGDDDVVTLVSENLDQKDLTAERVEQFKNKNQDILKEPNTKIGIFNMGDGKYSLDINVTAPFEKQKKTIEFAKKNNQKAIYSPKGGGVVETGGTGEATINTQEAAVAAAREINDPSFKMMRIMGLYQDEDSVKKYKEEEAQLTSGFIVDPKDNTVMKLGDDTYSYNLQAKRSMAMRSLGLPRGTKAVIYKNGTEVSQIDVPAWGDLARREAVNEIRRVSGIDNNASTSLETSFSKEDSSPKSIKRLSSNPAVSFQVELFHSSPYRFDAFKSSQVGKGVGKQMLGWGFYFLDKEAPTRVYATTSFSGRVLPKYTGKYKVGDVDVASRLRSEFYGDTELYKAQLEKESRKLFGSKSAKDEMIQLKKLSEELQKDNVGRFTYNTIAHKGKSPSEYDYIEGGSNLTESQVNKIGFDTSTTGQQAYESLAKSLGGEREASMYLLDKGIDGIKYSDGNIFSNKDRSKGNNVYVVFDERAVSIESAVAFSKEKDPLKGTYYESGLTESGDKYVFFHVSDADKKSIAKGIDSRKFNSTRTDKVEKGLQYGVASFYTKPEDGERMVGGQKYAVEVDKYKVYPMDTDPNNYRDKAESKIKIGTPFREENIRKVIADAAKKDGYEMAIGEWYYNRAGNKATGPEFRADALVPLKPSGISPDKYQSNESKGIKIDHPEKGQLQREIDITNLADDAYMARSAKGKYDDVYHLANNIRVNKGVVREDNDNTRPVSDEELSILKESLPSKDKKKYTSFQAEKLVGAKIDTKKPINTTAGVAKFLNAWAKKNNIFGRKNADKMSEEKALEILVPQIRKELHAWDEYMSSGYRGFYDQDVAVDVDTRLKRFAVEKYGRQLTDQEVALYHVLSSFASPSATPEFDSQKGLLLFDRYLRTGEVAPYDYSKDADVYTTNEKGERVPTGEKKKTETGEAIYPQVSVAYASTSLDKFNQIVEKVGGPDNAIDWISSQHSYDELSEMVGKPTKGPEALKAHEYLSKEDGGYGVFAMSGPKLGSYILNRLGNLQTVTKDMWYARSMARLFGEPLVDGKAAIKKPWEPTTKVGVKKRKIADKAFQILADERGVTPAVIQQQLWDFEKKLWQQLGAEASRPAYASTGLDKGIEQVYQNRGLISKAERVAQDNLPVSVPSDMVPFSKEKVTKTTERVVAPENSAFENLHNAFDASNPDPRFTGKSQETKKMLDKMATMTDQEIADEAEKMGAEKLLDFAKSFQGNQNFSLLFLIEQMKRAARSGDDTAVDNVWDTINQVGHTAGQLLAQMRALESATDNNQIIKKIVDRLFKKAGVDLTNDQKAELSDLVEKFVVTAAEEKKQYERYDVSRTPVNHGRMVKSRQNARAAAEDLQLFIDDNIPETLMDTLGSLLRGNLLSPISLGRNVFGNTLSMATSFTEAGIVYPLAAKLADPKNARMLPYWLPIIAGARGGWTTLKTLFPSIADAYFGTHFTAPDETISNKFEIRRQIRPFRSAKKLFTTLPKEIASGQKDIVQGLKEGLQNLLYATAGIPASLMFRALQATDVPFSEGFKAYHDYIEYYSKKANAGKPVSDLEGYQRNLSEGQKEARQKFARTGLFSDPDSFAAKVARKIITQTPQEIAKYTEANFPSFIAGPFNAALMFVRDSLAPYTTVPSNVVWTLFEYAVPALPLLESIQQFKKGNKVLASQLMGRAMNSVAMYTAASLVVEAGLMIDGDDDKKEKNDKQLKFAVGQPYGLNIDGLARMVSGGDPTRRDDDRIVDARMLGMSGLFLSFYSNYDRKLKESGIDKRPVDLVHDSVDKIMIGASEGTRLALDMSFMIGVETAMTSLFNVDQEAKGMGYGSSLAAQTIDTYSNAIWPNTLSQAIIGSAKQGPLTISRESFGKNLTERLAKKHFFFMSPDDLYPTLDVWGQRIENKEGAKNMANLWKSRTDKDPVAWEVMRLMNSTGEENPITIAQPTIEITNPEDGKQLNLQLKDSDRFILASLSGRFTKILVSSIMNDPSYESMSDAERVESVKEQNKEAKRIAREIFKGMFMQDILDGNIIITDPKKGEYQRTDKQTNISAGSAVDTIMEGAN